jgi:hypothetical protein
MNDTIPSPASNPTTETSSSSALAAPGEVLQVFSGIAAFDAAQRMARALCSSTLVPRDYQGQQGLANSLIALEIAARMRLSPLVVMQNMTPIHGRPTWSSKFLIATVNASGRFSPLRFVFDDKEKPSRCHAVATDKATGEVLEGETITLELARKEGWWSRKDRNGNETSKWQTMTGQMLRYRAAAWWANVYCPEIALGLITQEEALDIEAVAVREAEPAPAMEEAPAASPAPLVPAVASPAAADGETVTDVAVVESPARASATRASRRSAVPTAIRLRESEAVKPDAHSNGEAVELEVAPAPDGAGSTATTVEPQETTSDPGSFQADNEEAQLDAQMALPPRRPSLEEAPSTQAAPAQSRPKAEPEPSPAAPPPQATLPPPPPGDALESGLRQIPRITTLLELDGAYGRVNQLLAAGQITDTGAERLWQAIAKRRKQLENAPAAAEVMP